MRVRIFELPPILWDVLKKQLPLRYHIKKNELLSLIIQIGAFSYAYDQISSIELENYWAVYVRNDKSSGSIDSRP